MSKLYDSVAGSREMVANSRGVLVFPAVVGASLGIGAEYGRGALRTGGRTQAYYSTVDTNTIRQPVVGFVLTNVGLEAGVSLQGAKITEVQL